MGLLVLTIRIVGLVLAIAIHFSPLENVVGRDWGTINVWVFWIQGPCCLELSDIPLDACGSCGASILVEFSAAFNRAVFAWFDWTLELCVVLDPLPVF